MALVQRIEDCASGEGVGVADEDALMLEAVLYASDVEAETEVQAALSAWLDRPVWLYVGRTEQGPGTTTVRAYGGARMYCVTDLVEEELLEGQEEAPTR